MAEKWKFLSAYQLSATPVATIGVRGTDFSVSYDGAKTQIEVYDGRVEVAPKGFGDPEADLDGDGTPAWLDADADGDGSPNTSDPDDADVSIKGSADIGYAEVVVEEGEEAEVESGDEAPEIGPLPEGAEEEWQGEGEPSSEGGDEEPVRKSR